MVEAKEKDKTQEEKKIQLLTKQAEKAEIARKEFETKSNHLATEVKKQQAYNERSEEVIHDLKR
jgi:hypothetical protein